MKNKAKIMIYACLALCAFGARSQTAFLPQGESAYMASVSAEATDTASMAVMTLPEAEAAEADTLRITPGMIEEMRRNRRPEEFETSMESVTFVPKGQWVAGISVSYNQTNQNNFQFLILEGISGDTYRFKISPMLGYVFRDDMCAGLKFAYTRALTKLENADIVLDSETGYTADHVYSLGHNYYATAFYRNYFSIGHSRRFGFFNEIQCQLGGGQSKITHGLSDELTGSYETNFSLNVGIVPGLAVFLSDYSALEVSVGVLGFSYTHTKTINDRIYVAHRRSKLANFHINLFSITFGVAFYI